MKKIFYLLTVCLLGFVFVTPVSAESSAGQSGEDKLLEELRKFEQIDNQKLVQKYKSMFKGFANRNLDIDHDLLDYSKAEAYAIEGTELNVLKVPVREDKDSHESSNISVFFDKNNKITNYTEFYLTRTAQNTFDIKYMVDGAVQMEQVTDVEFTHGPEETNSDQISTFGFSVNKFAKCMNIPLVLAGIVATGCGAACAVTAGAGCVVCAGIVAGFTGGKTAQCLANSIS